LIVIAEKWQAQQVDEKNKKLSYDDIRKNCANKKALLTFEYRSARAAPDFDSEGSLDNRRLAARWTQQFQTT